MAERLKSNEALIAKLKDDMKRAVSDVESARSQEMELRKYISELEDKIKEGFTFDQNRTVRFGHAHPKIAPYSLDSFNE